MKLKNNLTREAILNMLIEQGYNEKQITELMDGLLYGIDIDEYINPSIEAKHIEMLMQFAREEEDLDRYFLPDGSLDDTGLEQDYKNHCRNAYGVDLYL